MTTPGSITLILILDLINWSLAANHHFRIAFGSCNYQFRNNTFLSFVASRNPDVFAWLGDIVYSDIEKAPNYLLPTTLEHVRDAFARMKSNPEYEKFRRSVPRIIGVWDDHDFGKNDGDKNFAVGRQAAPYLWDFLEEPVDSPRRAQSGVWSRHVLKKGSRAIRVLLLDNRSHKDPASRARNRIDETQDMLGDEQWAWLEAELGGHQDEKYDVTVIGLGVQMLARDKPVAEGMYQFPGSHARLLSLLALTQTSSTFFISGDVHLAELNHAVCSHFPYPLYDFTSSGMTHSLSEHMSPAAASFIFQSPRRIGPAFIEKNVGEIDIDWLDGEDGVITMRYFGPDQYVAFEHKISLSTLQIPADYVPSKEIQACAHVPLNSSVDPMCLGLLRQCSGRMSMFDLWRSNAAHVFWMSWGIFRYLFTAIYPLRFLVRRQASLFGLLVFVLTWSNTDLSWTKDTIWRS